MTSADGRSVADDASGTVQAAQERHETPRRSAGPSRASMVSALRGTARHPAAEPGDAPRARPWGPPDTLAAAVIALAPTAVVAVGGFGAPGWVIGLVAAILVLALGALVLRGVRGRPVLAGSGAQVSASRFPPAP